MSPTSKLIAASLALASLSAPAKAQIPAAHYVCYHFTTPLPLLNFTITGNGQYTDAGGAHGTFRANGNGQFVFSGGNFDGQTAVFRSGNPPTVAFMGTGGGETETCQPGKD